MPFGSTGQSVAIAGAACGGIAVLVGAAINAGLFHKFQKLTPQTWRSEGTVQYVQATLARVLTGVGFPLLFAYTGMPRMPGKDRPLWEIGLIFGVLVWAAIGLPMTLSKATFVNWHRGVVVGMLLDWLLVAGLCGIACAMLVMPG